MPKPSASDRFQKKLDQLNHDLHNARLSTLLEANITLMGQLFAQVDTLLHRRFQNQLEPDLDFCIFYTDGVVDSTVINDFIIKPLMHTKTLTPDRSLLAQIKNTGVVVNEIQEEQDITTIIQSVTYGDTILFVSGFDTALIISTKSFSLRSISEPLREKSIFGPREGFTEGILTNLSMLRRRLRTHHLKMSYQTIGRESATTICLCYLDNIVNPSILEGIKKRLEKIDMDAVLDPNYLIEQMAASPFFQFPLCGSTERPDIVTARLLEGRVAILVDGSPMVVTAPYLFIENFQSNEDYYVPFFYATFSRLLRFLGFLISVIAPALYVSIIAYHQALLPTSLLTHIVAELKNAPMPAAVEAFVVFLCFDLLREAGVRMPEQVGQTLSIVGALVIGQAAVDAGLVTTPMIIIVGLTGITGLIIPRLTPSVILTRYLFLALASGFGLYGLLIGFSLFFTNLFNTKSFGVSYVTLPNRMNLQVFKDTLIRAPWHHMLTRYLPLSQNRNRQPVDPAQQTKQP